MVFLLSRKSKKEIEKDYYLFILRLIFDFHDGFGFCGLLSPSGRRSKMVMVDNIELSLSNPRINLAPAQTNE